MIKKRQIITAMGLLALCSLALATEVNDPIAHWKFDEGSGSMAYDSAGSNNGTITGASWFSDPFRGMCLSFDGNRDYVLIGNKDNLEQQAFTLSFWARLNNPSGSLQGGVAKGRILCFGDGTQFSYSLDFSGGTARAGITNTSDTAFSVTGPIVDAGWHMWSMTVEGGTLTLYKDGAFVNSTGYTGTIDYAKLHNNFVIGARDNGSCAFNGKIDDVRFYNRALSAGEIGQLYIEGLGPKAFNPNPVEGAAGVDPNTILGWSPGKDAASHDVYLGTDYNDVNDADVGSPEYRGNFDVSHWDPCELELMTTYYWRIDEVNDSNLWKGYVWSFETARPAIELSATQFQFTAIEGGTNPDGQILGISNSGFGTLNWQISEGCGWLSVEPTSGSSTGEVDNVNLIVDISGLAAGIYICNLTISDINASNNPQMVSITLHVGDYDGILHVPSEYSTIQAAIDVALNGDVVIVAPGMYTGDGNRDIDFKGKAITVRSTNPNDPDVVAATVIDCNGTESEPHRGFYFHNNEDANSILAGLTTINGYDNYGSGITCSGSSPTIINCTFSGNSADYGGGMSNYSSNSTVTNCTFSDSSASKYGGGMFNSSSRLTITNCTFSRNSAGEGGGGMYNDCSNSCRNPTLINCTFSDNSASEGGGIFNFYNDPTLTNCIFSGNQVYSDEYDSGGGGIYNDSSNPTLTNCTFSGNQAYSDEYDSCGGGIFNDSSNPTVTNCTFNGNSALRGGGMYNSESSPTLTNCTFSGNSAFYGGGMYNFSSSLILANSILWGNTALRGAEIYNHSSTATVSFSDVQGGWAGTGNINTDPCFVKPGQWVDANDPNIIVEPNDPNAIWVDGDYHLKSEGWSWDVVRQRWTYDDVTSRCIDAGNPGSPLADEPLTLIVDPLNRWGQNLRIDMGAFGGTAEASIPPYDWAMLSDATNDGISDFSDLDILSSLWLNTGEQLYADFNRDGIIDLFDFALLAQGWLKQTTWHE